MSSAEQIQALEAEIARKQQELQTLRDSSKKQAIAQVRELIQQYGLTSADLAGVVPGAALNAKALKKAKPSVKYYDPNSGKGWSGAARGKIPEPFNGIIKSFGGDREKAADALSQYLVR